MIDRRYYIQQAVYLKQDNLSQRRLGAHPQATHGIYYRTIAKRPLHELCEYCLLQ